MRMELGERERKSACNHIDRSTLPGISKVMMEAGWLEEVASKAGGVSVLRLSKAGEESAVFSRFGLAGGPERAAARLPGQALSAIKAVAGRLLRG